MANEFKHKDPGSELTQAEYITTDGTGHIFDCQATGDIMYASSTTVLKNLSRGAANEVLSMGGSCIPDWTSTPTLASLTVDDVVINGKVVTMTGSACDTIVMTAAANGAFSLVTTDTAAAAANIQITADGTVDIDSAGVLTLDSGAAINIEPAACSVILLDCTISIDAGVVTGATSITSTVIELGHASDTTIARSGSGAITVECNQVYLAGGTDVALADGGTGASLSDPGADRLVFWDDGAGAIAFLTAGSGLTICGTTMTASGGADLGTANTWTADQSFTDCVKVTFGSGGDADIYYNGTNLVIAPDVVGNGNVQIDARVSLNSCINQGVLNLNTTDEGSEGVWIVANHDTASPANNDFPFGIYVFAPASDDSSHVIASMMVKRCDVCSASSDSHWRFDVQYNSGAAANRSGLLTSAGVWTDHSAAKDKEFQGDATTVWGSRVIDKLAALTVQRFHQPCLPASKTPIHHVSPTAEDLWEMFGVGDNPYTLTRDTTGDGVMDSPTPGIAAKDLAGLGLMAVQELTLEINTIKTRLTAAGIG